MKDEYDQLVVNREDIARAKQIIRVVIAKLKVHSKYLEPKDTGVKVPFAMTIVESLPNDGNVWQMTVAERVMKYLSMNTKLHMDQRPRLVHKETGAFYPIATYEDLRDTLPLMERAATNIRPYVAEWYERVFLPAFQDLDGKPNEYQNDQGIVYEKEYYVGLSTEQLAAKTQEIMQGRKPSTDETRGNYLDPLINLGLIEKVPSVKDSKRNIYFPTEFPANGHNTTGNTIRVTDHNLYPSRNVIEESFRTLILNSDGDTQIFDQITNYRIEDIDSRKIELDELLDSYFSQPEEYFKE